jgi:AAA ATPase domain
LTTRSSVEAARDVPPPAGSRLADRLAAARRRGFVGREPEIRLFRAAVTSPELPFQVLYIHGPGGVGKTSLLREFGQTCNEEGFGFSYLDGRDLEPTADALTQALGAITDSSEGMSFRRIVAVDTFETLGSLDAWLRDTFLPLLPADVLFVVAGREPPSPAWRADPGWQTLFRTLPLRNLSRAEAEIYLDRRSVPGGEQQAVLDFTHGHPLALSLVADLFAQGRAIHFQSEAAPDIVRTLLQQFVQKVPGPAHRTALEACALLRLTTEGLLAAMLAMPDAHELFEWLRGLSFVESGQQGLFPHDLAREALVADLRWRNPDWYAELHRRARTYYIERVQQLRGAEQQRALIDLIFLHRDNQAVRPFFELLRQAGDANREATAGSSIATEPARDEDVPELVAMVRQHEGDDSAEHASRWLAAQRHNALVFRDADGRPAGFMFMLALDRASANDIAVDPAAVAARRYLTEHGPLRPGERSTLFRFWMAREAYQSVSAIQGLVFVEAVRHYLVTPGLAMTFFPCAEPGFWAPMFAYADLARLPETDFEVGGRRYGMYGHDWRQVPPMVWLDLLAEREIAATPPSAQAPPAREPLMVLSRTDFSTAVHDALRNLLRPDGLRANPLLRSRLVVERVGGAASAAERSTALQALVHEACERLRQSDRELKLYRALDRTYLRPAPTQERAAELLDVPFSTYRRHLRTATETVADHLWSLEIGAV